MPDYKKYSVTISLISDFLTLSFKFGVLIGSLCLLFYCHRISYFPYGVSIGDSLYFVLLATSFGFIYGIFLSCLISLALCFSFALYFLQKSIRYIYIKKVKGPLPEPWEFPLPNFIVLPLSIVGLPLMWMIIKKEPDAIGQFLFMLVCLVLLLSVYKTSTNSNKFARRTNEQKLSLPAPDIEKKKKISTICLVLIAITPLMIGGISGVLVEASMRAANVRKDYVYIMLRTPYSAFVPKQFQTQLFSNTPDLTAFKDITVLFSGIGEKTVIQFRYDGREQNLTVPNDSIIVIPRENTS